VSTKARTPQHSALRVTEPRPPRSPHAGRGADDDRRAAQRGQGRAHTL